MKGSRIVVTGGAGFIGTNLVRTLLEKGATEVVVIDNLSSGNAHFLPKDPQLSLFSVDVYHADELRSVLKGRTVDYVFHLAAHFANQNSIDHPIRDVESNVLGTIHLFELLRQSPPRKVVYASSSCVYGSVDPMVEDAFVYPHETPYAINKYVAELYIAYYATFCRIPAVSVRIFNTYGPYELAGHYRNVIPNFIERALKGKDLVITGTGEETRDFTYVSDTVDCMLLAAESPFRTGEVFNSGTGTSTRIADLAQRIVALTGSRSRIVKRPRRDWDQVTARRSHVSKAVQWLGYRPRVGLDEGLRGTVDWYKGVIDEV